MPAEVVKPRELEGRAIRQKLKELLSGRGRNARKDGDYYIVESDSGTYDQKVLVFRDDVIDDVTIKTVSKMLEHYSMDWTVLFVDADKDGTEVTPQTGVEVCSHNLVMDIYQPPTPEELTEWETTEDLYDELLAFFAIRGTGNAFGGGDYWLWDDKWVRLSHWIHINNIEFLTPTLINDVQDVLRRRYPSCVLWIQIDAQAPGIEVPCEGVIVHADRLEEHWNRDALRSIFKDKFKF